MLNRSSLAPNARDLGKFWRAVAAMRPAPPRRWPGLRLGKEAEGILLLAAILVVVCAYVLLMDHLGIPPAAVTDLPLVD